MKSRIRGVVPALPFAIAGLGIAVLTVLDAGSASRAALIDSFADDAYYYFEIASNLAAGRGSTFDGLNLTNGYHPLWLAVQVPIFEIGAGKYETLVLVKALSAGLWMASIGLLFLWGKRWGAAAWLLPSVALLVYCSDFWFNGMESALALPLVMLTLYLAWKGRVLDAGKAMVWPASLALAAAVLARLDLVYLVASLALVILSSSEIGTWKERMERMLRLGAPATLAVILYMGVSHGSLGSPFPVSGQAKSLGAPHLNFDVVGHYFLSKPVSAPGLRYLNALTLIIVSVLPALVLLRSHVEGKHRLLDWRPETSLELTKTLYVLLLANSIQLTHYGLATSWPLWQWYNYYFPLLLVLGLVPLTAAAFRMLRLDARRQTLAVIFFCLFFMAKLHQLQTYFDSRKASPVENYRTQSVQVADVMNDLHADGAIAMGDRAGSLAYQLERPLVQTEGLVGSVEYLRALREGSVHRYLQANNVKFVAYSGGQLSGGVPTPLQVEARSDRCFELVEPKFGHGPRFRTVVCDEDKILELQIKHDGAMGGGYYVWHYRSDLNPQ